MDLEDHFFTCSVTFKLRVRLPQAHDATSLSQYKHFFMINMFEMNPAAHFSPAGLIPLLFEQTKVEGKKEMI